LATSDSPTLAEHCSWFVLAGLHHAGVLVDGDSLES
jgi:hypothetical protein